MNAISEAFLSKITEMTSQNISNMSWSFATLTYADEELMKAISAEAIARISDRMEKNHDLFAAYEFTADLLALAWSLALSMEMTTQVARPLRDQVL